MVISEFLAALGLKDNFSRALDKTLKKGEKSIGKFGSTAAKQFALAGAAIGAFLLLAIRGIVKFTGHLLQYDDSVKKLVKDLGISREAAADTKSALDAMGKSLDEIKADPALLEQFEELKKTAASIRPPDMSEGLAQVREISKEVTRLKQLAGIAIQWIGHYFLKYIQQPLERFKKSMKGFNESFSKAIPKISEGIGKVMAWIVRIGLRVAQGAQAIWKVITTLLDMIPDKLKIVGVALLALNAIMKMGPFGLLVTLIAAALLLLDDFLTFMEGGESIFGDFWQKLVDNEAIGKFQEAFESLKTAFGDVMETLDTLLSGLFSDSEEAGSGIESFLVWLIGTAIPGLLNGLGKTISFIANFLNWFLKIPGIIDILKVFLGVLVAWKVAMAAVAIATALASAPITLIILAVLALIAIVYLLIKNWDKVVDFFKDLWKKIKGVFANIGKWFGDKFDQAKEAVINAFWSIVQWFQDRLMDIYNVFAGIGNWFSEKFTAAREGIQSVFGEIVGWFSEKINAIKNFFASIPGAAKNAMISVVQGIMEKFQPVVDWFKTKVDAIKGFFSGLWDGIKNAAGAVGDFFTGGGGDAPPAPTGGHAEGGIFNKAHVASFAEGNKAEAIVPLTKPGRAAEVLAGIGKFLGVSGGGEGIDLTPLVSMVGKMVSTVTAMSKTVAGVQGVPIQATAGGTGRSQENKVDTVINVYDKSGNPQTTARAVDKNQKNVIRSLEGMLV